jgi:hypothetical protein
LGTKTLVSERLTKFAQKSSCKVGSKFSEESDTSKINNKSNRGKKNEKERRKVVEGRGGSREGR